jgi:flagellar M-ring protein FliF
MSIFQKLLTAWEQISLIQRALMMAVLMTCVLAGGFLTHWASRPDMRLLYQDVDPEEASKITEKISEMDIKYELRDSGTSIYVPKKHVYQLRLDMAREGLPTGGQQGYKLFDEQSVGVSPAVQDVNLKRALEEELSKSIQMIDGVLYARLHVVSPKKSLFSSQSEKTTASVVLRLKAGYRLSPSNIAAITHLVAGGVEGLEPQSITVTDSKGNLLAKDSDEITDHGAGTVQDYRERVEKNLEDKVLDMLMTVLGPGRATVKVSALVDMESGSIVTENYDPAKRVVAKEEIRTNSETKPDLATAEGGTPVRGGQKKDEVVMTDYSVGKTVEQKINLPGKILSLSVAAVVDLSMPDANGVVAENSPKIMEASKVEELISNALGLHPKSSEEPDGTATISVVEARFYHQLTPEIEDSSPGLDYIAIAGQASFGVMAVCALVILRAFSMPKKKQKASGKAIAVTSSGKVDSIAELDETAGLLPAESETEQEDVDMNLQQEIAIAVRKNPDDVKQLFARMIEE